VKSAEEKAASKIKAEAKKAKQPSGPQQSAEKKKRGRPKGSKNKDKRKVVLSAELLRIQSALRSFLKIVATAFSLDLVYLHISCFSIKVQ
jgi:hypothetical protein